MKDFKEFLLRGNLVDVAVGIVIGVAFAALVTVDEQTRQCPECLSDVPVLASRCAFCTAQIGAAA
jgi:hypothetical protein